MPKVHGDQMLGQAAIEVFKATSTDRGDVLWELEGWKG